MTDTLTPELTDLLMRRHAQARGLVVVTDARGVRLCRLQCWRPRGRHARALVRPIGATNTTTVPASKVTLPPGVDLTRSLDPKDAA